MYDGRQSEDHHQSHQKEIMRPPGAPRLAIFETWGVTLLFFSPHRSLKLFANVASTVEGRRPSETVSQIGYRSKCGTRPLLSREAAQGCQGASPR